MVKGDLIYAESTGIKTRSRAKQSKYSPCFHVTLSARINEDTDPDQYTVIPATLKILKVLIQELLSASGSGAAAAHAAAMANAAADYDSDDGDDTWEDEPDTLDLGLGSRADMLALGEEGARLKDDETQAYLSEFFMSAARDNVAGFQEWYGMLTGEERSKLEELAAERRT